MYYFFLFWCLFCILIVLGYILLDIMFLFSPKIAGKVVSIDIFSRNLTTHGTDEWFDISINYSYQYQGIEYSSNVLNAWNNVYTKNRSSLERLIEDAICENEITVYVLPWKPRFACVFPLKWNKIVPVSILLIFSITSIVTVFINNAIYLQ